MMTSDEASVEMRHPARAFVHKGVEVTGGVRADITGGLFAQDTQGLFSFTVGLLNVCTAWCVIKFEALATINRFCNCINM